MAAAFVGGALLGAVFGELLKTVSEATKKAGMFKDLLEKLESTLKSKIPTIQEIERLNQQLDLPKEETEILKEMMMQGEQLVLKCAKVKRINFFKRHDYAKRLLKLNSSLDAYIQTNIPLQGTRDNRMIMVDLKEVKRDNSEIKVDLKEVHTIVKRLSGNEQNSWMFNQVGIVGACSVPDPPVNTPGLDVPLKELKMDLLESGKQVIVVSAPGGYGKTTLVKKLCKDDQIHGKFKDNIFFVTVSKTPNVKVIVQKVFQHKGYPVPEFQTVEVAIDELERLLKQISPEAILLVLDDVWSGSESLVQKFMFQNQLPNYKILVTSRSVFPRFGTGHDLKPLNDEAARTLFHYSANLQDGNSYISDKNLVNKILRVCKGCPLALTVVGGSLRGQPEAIWQRRVKKWAQDVSIFDSNADILDCLKSSLDALNNEVKECYMDLCSFPEDQRIPITALIDMWMELYEPDEDGLFAITNLHELSHQNLVNRVFTRKNASDDDCQNDHFVMQHDLLRELTIHQSMLEPLTRRKRLIIDLIGNNFPKWWVNQKEHPVNASLLSISTDETFSSNWYDLQVPEVKVVVLNVRTKKYTLPNFMEKMDELKVLIVTNYGFFPTELSNFQVLGSVSNLKRIRLEHVSLPSMITVQMKNLQKLSLVMCNVGQAFRNSTFQISDAFPNLLEIDIDYCNDLVELPDGLCDIVSIKKLRITNCHRLSALPEGIGKLVNLQMLTIASCTDLSALPDTVGNLSNLEFLDISECLSIQELPEQIGELCSLKTLCMKGCYISKRLSSIVNLENLEVVKCDEETARQLEYLQLGCKNLTIEELQEDINLNWLHNPHL